MGVGKDGAGRCLTGCKAAKIGQKRRFVKCSEQAGLIFQYSRFFIKSFQGFLANNSLAHRVENCLIAMVEITGAHTQAFDVVKYGSYLRFWVAGSLPNVDRADILWVNLANVFVNRGVMLRIIT